MKHSIDFAGFRLPPAPGWPSERQHAFLVALSRTGDVCAAAREVGEIAGTLHHLRQDRGPYSNFARAWKRALSEARLDVLASRVLRKHGLAPNQLALVDAVCRGADKARLTLALFRRSNASGAARPIR